MHPAQALIQRAQLGVVARIVSAQQFLDVHQIAHQRPEHRFAPQWGQLQTQTPRLLRQLRVDSGHFARDGRGLQQRADHVLPVGRRIGQQLQRTRAMLDDIVADLADGLAEGGKQQGLGTQGAL